MIQHNIGKLVNVACLMEVITPKPGNVHRGADFEDLTFFDMATSAAAISTVMEQAAQHPLGETILKSIQATHELVNTNTNLGIVLLIAPLAAVPHEQKLITGVKSVLQNLTARDAELVYQAIQLAKPGGMNSVPEADVSGDAPESLLAAMELSAEHDLIAKQYVTNFEIVLGKMQSWIQEDLQKKLPLQQMILHVFLKLLSEEPDSLIARKCGKEVAEKASSHAKYILECDEVGSETYERAISDLDFWLRSDGHRRNPGTTADMITAALFVALREGTIRGPFNF